MKVLLDHDHLNGVVEIARLRFILPGADLKQCSSRIQGQQRSIDHDAVVSDVANLGGPNMQPRRICRW